ncbi:HAD family hydrolase [Actinomadura violacea]|uniref:HAD-IA family hydrolase n=1 Tax=Actinomadura violacea TaxID=2819934 RepID=A0ABS3RNF5_9ACTN|nr:HAD-IA family hydrolase [Actinomadura violacea]MBO2458088.1 HAD-IA family hydrolase [Actinomadura violacea]
MNPGTAPGAAVPPQAVLIDFGGVLTSGVFDAFRAVSHRISGDPRLIERILREDGASGRLLAEHECGRLGQAGFEEGFAERLRAHGVATVPAGLVTQIQDGLRLDEAMLTAVARLRSDGVPVAIVSNAFGDDCYQGVDLYAIADAVVISSDVGVRKPSQSIYRIACERLGADPAACVMIDDLRHNLDGAERLGIRGLHHLNGTETVHRLAEIFGLDLGPDTGGERPPAGTDRDSPMRYDRKRR